MPSPKNIPRVCLVCQKDFLACKSDINRGKGIYCSSKCNISALANKNKTSKEGWLYYRQARRGLFEYREKENARHKIYRAVKTGKIIKPLKCEKCKEVTTLKAAIQDYKNPFVELKFYCSKCHPTSKRSIIEDIFY